MMSLAYVNGNLLIHHPYMAITPQDFKDAEGKDIWKAKYPAVKAVRVHPRKLYGNLAYLADETKINTIGLDGTHNTDTKEELDQFGE